MDATAWAELWATVCFFILFGIFLYMKVPTMLAKALDQRAEGIRKEFEEARRLREEAQQLLAEYLRKRKEAEQEAKNIIAIAEREAELLRADAERKSEEYVARRTKLAEQKIAQAESDAVKEVRAKAVDIAVAAAADILARKVDDKVDADLFRQSLTEVESQMH